MLEANGKPKQIFRCTRARPFDRRPMFDETFRTAKARGASDDAESRGERHRRVATATDLKGHHAAKLGHLPRGHVVSRMVGEPRVVHRFDAIVIVEIAGE